jgi:beta-lactamase superfamily II metal-dependent hydrolase
MTRNDTQVFVYTSASGEFISFNTENTNYVIDISTGKYLHIHEALLSVKELSSTQVDNLVLTHYHQHHGNSLYRLADIIKIRNVLLPLPETEKETEYFEEIKAILENQEINYVMYTRGTTYSKDNVEIDFSSFYKIPRSEKPIVAFKVSTSAGAFSYIESAAFEGNKDYDEYIC